MSEASNTRQCVFCRNSFPVKDGWHDFVGKLYACSRSPLWLVDWDEIETQMRKDFERDLNARKERWFNAGKPPVTDIRERDLQKEAYEEWLDRGTYKTLQTIKTMRGFDS